MNKRNILKKNTIKNILIIFTAMLVVPVIAFAVTTAENPSDNKEDQNRDIKITSTDNDMEVATTASPVLTSDAAEEPDAVSSATGDPQDQNNQDSTKPDAVSSATGDPDGSGDDYDSDSDEDDDEDDDDHNAIKEDDDDDEEEDDD